MNPYLEDAPQAKANPYLDSPANPYLAPFDYNNAIDASRATMDQAWQRAGNAMAASNEREAATVADNQQRYREEFGGPRATGVTPAGTADTAFLETVSKDPMGFAKAIPDIAFGAVAAPGKLAYNAAADVVSSVANQPEYGGNLASMMAGADRTPAETFIAGAAKDAPKLAVAANVAKVLPELASMMAVNPSGAAGRLLALGFSADMIHKAKPLFDEYAAEKNLPEPNAGKLAELEAGIIQTFAFAPLAGAHGVGALPKEIAYARDVARGNTPVGRDGRAATVIASQREAIHPRMPAEEGAPVPAWDARESFNPYLSPEPTLPPAARQSDVARPAEAEAAPAVTTKNVPADAVLKGSGVKPSPATPPEQSLPPVDAPVKPVEAETQKTTKKAETPAAAAKVETHLPAQTKTIKPEVKLAETPVVQQKAGFDAKAAKAQKKFLIDETDKAITEAPHAFEPVPADQDMAALEFVRSWKAGDTAETFAVKQGETFRALAQKYNVDASHKKAFELFENAIKQQQFRERPKVTIEVPGDGTFDILNSKTTLQDFKQRAAKFPTTAPRAKVAGFARETPSAATPLGKPTPENVLKGLRDVVSTDPDRAVIQNVWSDGNQTVATDGRRLTIIKVGIGGTEKSPKVFSVDGKEVKIPKTEKQYPEWRQVVPREWKEEMKGLDTERLFTVFRQAQEATSEKQVAVTLWRNKDGSLGVSSVATGETSYSHNISPSADPFISVNPQFVLDALNTARRMGDKKVNLVWIDELAPMGIHSDKSQTVMMPIRMSTEAAEVTTRPKAGSPGGSGIGFPMAAPVPAIPPPAPAPGVTLIQHGRLPVTLDRTAPGSVSVPQIMDSMQNVLRVAGSDAGNIRTGRLLQKALGIWKPHEEIIRMESADSIPTATHEIGHGLQQKIYGTAMASGLKFLGPAIRRELIGMGKALYGSRKPVAGYTGEGFAEFARYWLTTEDAPRVAQNLTKFFETVFLPKHPEVARALTDARDLVTIWRHQGSVERANRQLVREPGAFKRVAEAVARFVGYQSQFESAAPIEAVSRAAAKKLGRQLPASEDPFKLYSWKRGTAGATVERMATEHMLDVWGNPVGPSLAEALAPVKGKRNEFLLYIWAQAAEMRWKQNKNPGISLPDAQHIKGLYDSPEFRLAADKYRKWNDQLLDYVVQADPAMAEAVKAMRGANDYYAPLARMIDPAKAKAVAAQAKSNSMMRMFGSGLPVKDIFDQTFINAARLVNRANRALVTRNIVKLSNIQGLGHIVEEVPRDRIGGKLNVEQIRKQLEDMGVDTTKIPPDEMLQYFSLADMPKGSDPIITIKDSAGAQRWYQVDPRLYDTLEGLKTFSLKQAFPGIPYLGTMLDLVLGVPSRAFRMGTTGLRPAFSLVTNPLRDVATLLAQSSSNPAKVAALYPAALREAITGGKYKDAFFDLGAHLGQPLGTDIGHTKRVSNELFHGRIMRVVKNPVDHLRELLSITESAPRIAELRAVADDIGWKPGTPLSPDQAVQLALAAKRVTVDFSAAGDVSRILNQAIPFYNPALQGMRSFARSFKNNPGKATLMGLSLFTAPALIAWWQNKDKEWYRALPWRERYLYSHIDDGTNVWQIPRPFEWGNAFMVIPEALFNSWYRHDPEASRQALSHIFESTNPVDLPVFAKIAKEQWQNRISFWDRPIVPRGEVDLPASEQVGPYTSRLAVGINKAFPELSPRRIDAAIRGYFGGTGTDVMQLLGVGSQKMDRDWEASDFPVFGTVFRRGGEFNAQNQHINDFWETYLPSKSRVDGFSHAKSQVQQGLRKPETMQPPAFGEFGVVQVGESASKAIRLLTMMAGRTRDTKARAELYRQAGEIARDATVAMKNAQRPPQAAK